MPMRTAFALVVLCSACLQSAVADELAPLVFQSATVFDAQSGRMIADESVVVEGGRITAVVPADGQLSIPAGARVIDAHGKYVIPGLIDGHAHVAHHAVRTHVAGDETLPLYLPNGVTSLRSTGDPVVAEVGVAHYAESHPDRCPRLFLASPLIDGEHIHTIRITESALPMPRRFPRLWRTWPGGTSQRSRSMSVLRSQLAKPSFAKATIAV